MHPPFQSYTKMLETPQSVFELAAVALVQLCVAAVLMAVLLNFLSAHTSGRVARKQKSPVATGSMLAFFLSYYLIVHNRIAVVRLESLLWQDVLIAVGLAVMILGTLVNLMGRLRLGSNWANQVTVYTDQTLVTGGVYGIVRHPLYASLIWMFYAGSLIYRNWGAFLATSLIFLPAMFLRARQEEAFLVERFPDYPAYRSRVGMFFPKITGGRKDAVR
ncbi:MAG: isoprenylcysteine carboxylmethyltransferase family protein [Armatimonadetes bacterium]|nr:isoprenylcysteine carboxylmethyltransferase family protein [Armatimonadota bacterium]